MITIGSIDDLMQNGVDMIMGEIQPDEIKIDGDFTFTIKVCGDTWDDAIDYRTANFILDLQKAINHLYTEIHGDIIPLRNLSKLVTVKVKVEKGSLTYNIDLAKVIGKMVGNMTGPETLIFTGIFAGTVIAAYTVKKVIERKKEVELKAKEADKDVKVIEQMTSTINKALDVIERKDVQAPVRKLIAKMDEGDTIALPNEEPIRADVAKKRYPRRPRAKNLSGLFDTTYTIDNINLAKSPPEFTICHGSLYFEAAAELGDDDIRQITRDLETAMKNGVDFTIRLNVFIVYNEHKIISASIQGAGAPRENSQDINELLQLFKLI